MLKVFVPTQAGRFTVGCFPFFKPFNHHFPLNLEPEQLQVFYKITV